MRRDVVDTWVDAAVDALTPLGDHERARGNAAYMKHVASFLGIPTPVRRRVLTLTWRSLPALTEPEVADVCGRLWALPEREYQYAACDLLSRRSPQLSPSFIPDVVEPLLTSKPWWDTVDSLGSAAITPVVSRSPDLVALMWTWLRSGDRWLVRAAIQHQRGLRERTDLDRLIAMCDEVSTEKDFFIAKAVGWALRDVTNWNPRPVQAFLDAHPELPAVARREAVKGLARSGRP